MNRVNGTAVDSLNTETETGNHSLPCAKSMQGKNISNMAIKRLLLIGFV